MSARGIPRRAADAASMSTTVVPAAPPRPLSSYLPMSAVSTGAVYAVVALVVALLAASRAHGHALSPVALAGLAAGMAAASAIATWPVALYAGALDVLAGRAALDCGPDCPAAQGGDPWTAAALWRRALGLAALVGAWALAGGGLVAVALHERPAHLAVLYMTLIGTSRVAAVAAGAAARHPGAP